MKYIKICSLFLCLSFFISFSMCFCANAANINIIDENVNIESDSGTSIYSLYNENYFSGYQTVWCNYGSGYMLHLKNGNTPNSTHLNLSKNSEFGQEFNWIFMYSDDSHEYVTIRPASNINICVTPYDAEGMSDTNEEVIMEEVPTELTNRFLWEIVSVDNTNTLFYIKNKQYATYYLSSTQTGGLMVTRSNNDLTKWNYCSWDNHSTRHVTSFSLNQIEYVPLSNATFDGEVEIESVSPSNAYCSSTNYFRFSSMDPSVATVDSQGRISSHKEGQTVIYVTHRPTGKIRYIPIIVGDPFSANEYYIINKETGQFMDIENASNSEGANICVSSFTNETHTKWRFIKGTDNRYYIQSVYNGKYIGLSETIGSNNIVQYSNIMHDVYVVVSATKSGAYKLVTSSGKQSNMAIGVNSTGGNMIYQNTYTQNDTYYDEWIIVEATESFAFSTGIGYVEDTYYYFKNIATDRYMVSASINAGIGTNVTTEANLLLSNSRFLWKIGVMNETNALNQIYPKTNSTGYILNIAGSNANIHMNYGTSNQKFKIVRLNVYPYEGVFLVISNGKYLAVNPNDNYNVYVTDELTEYCFWSVQDNSVQKADIFYFTEPNDDTSEFVSTVSTLLTDMDYYSDLHDNESATDFFDEINNRKSHILIFRGHSESARLVLYDEEEETTCSFTVSDTTSSGVNKCVNSITANISDMKIIMLLGCKSGTTNANGENFLNAFYNKGVHFVICTYETVYTKDGAAFMFHFFDALSSHMNIKDAINYAKNHVPNVFYPSYGEYGAYPVVYMGDIYQKIN